MDQWITVLNTVVTTITPGAVGLGVVGSATGLAMSAIGYKHGSDVLRTSLIGAGLVLGAKACGAWFQKQFGL
jgi:hypothetical protein